MWLSNNFNFKAKNTWLIFAFILVILILWNTNALFDSLSLQERSKMELWAMAQKEYIKNPSLSNLTFEVLQRSGTNPIIQVDEFDKIVEIRNIDWDNKKQDSIKLYNILSQIKKSLIKYLLINLKNYSILVIILKKLI